MAITAAEYKAYSKEALQAALAEANNKITRMGNRAQALYQENKETVDEVLDYAGAVIVGPVTALGVGFLETRYLNKDGTPLSLGPVPLSVVVAGGAAIAGIFSPKWARKQLLFVTAANLGAAGNDMGRGYGVIRRAKALAGQPASAGVEGLGGVGYFPGGTVAGEIGARQEPADQDWSPAELALLEGNEGMVAA